MKFFFSVNYLVCRKDLKNMNRSRTTFGLFACRIVSDCMIFVFKYVIMNVLYYRWLDNRLKRAIDENEKTADDLKEFIKNRDIANL